MKTILSTKKLTAAQEERLRNHPFKLRSYNAISITLTDFEIPPSFDFGIFTSKNAVRSLLAKNEREPGILNPGMPCFCVGQKTAALLQRHGFSITKSAADAASLANWIIARHPAASFALFCGNLRRKELPGLMKQNGIRLREVEVYKTEFNPCRFEEPFDGLLFFSPSAVDSYCTRNNMGHSIAFCIGPTTAGRARHFTERVRLAGEASVESVLNLLCSHFSPGSGKTPVFTEKDIQ